MLRLPRSLFFALALSTGSYNCEGDPSSPPSKDGGTSIDSTFLHGWSAYFGDADEQYGESAVVDALGNVIVTGYLAGTADFGGGPLTSAGDGDIFIAKFDSSGNHIWSRRFGDGSLQSAESAAVDASGNVIVAGTFRGTVDFGGGPLTNTGSWDAFVVKFDADGNHMWSTQVGGGLDQRASSVTVDNQGNVIVSGQFLKPLSPLGGFSQVFVAKFDAGGNPVWSNAFGDASLRNGSGEDVVLDASGNVIMTGFVDGTVDFGGGKWQGPHIHDIFVVKFDAGGNHVWSKRFGDRNNIQIGQSVVLDAFGDVTVTGSFEGTVDFGGGTLRSAGGYDIFVAKFDADGNHVWSRRSGDDAYRQIAASAAVDASGNVMVTGYFGGTVSFGGGKLTSAGGYDIFVAAFDPGGSYIWSRRFGDANDQYGAGIVVDVLGRVIVTGGFAGSVNFGGDIVTSEGGYDIFLVRFVKNPAGG